MTSFHRVLNNKPIELDEQTEYYKSYWDGIKNQSKNLKKKFKELEIGDVIKVPLSGETGWRYDGTDRTTLQNYLYTVENSRDFDCFVVGTVVSTNKKRKNYFVTIKLTNVDNCEYKNPIYNEKEVSVGKLMEINMAIDKVIIE